MRCLVIHCLGAHRSDWAAFALWVMASFALAGTPDYDAFSERDGEIATTAQEIAAWKMLSDPEQLEAVAADAARGSLRAVHVMQQLEATLAASGRKLAERTSRTGCLVPGYKELSGKCRPDWSFLDFLSKDRAGGVRLRTAIFDAFVARARERGLENQAILSVVNGLLSLELAGAVLRKAEVGANVPRIPESTRVPAVQSNSVNRPQAVARALAEDAEASTSRLTGADRAVIDPRKLTEYALNPNHLTGGNKARVFQRLGFNLGNTEDLMRQLRAGVKENAAIPGKVDEFGARFTVDIPVVGPQGSGTVRTGWILKPGSSVPELTTLFVK